MSLHAWPPDGADLDEDDDDDDDAAADDVGAGATTDMDAVIVDRIPVGSIDAKSLVVVGKIQRSERHSFNDPITPVKQPKLLCLSLFLNHLLLN